MRGTVSNAFDVTPPLASFDDQLVAGEQFPATMVDVRYRDPLRSVRADAEPTFGRVALRHSEEDSRRFQVEVFPNENLAPGPFDFVVPIVGETMAGETLAPLPLRVVGRVLARLQLFPEKLSLGVHDKGSTVDQSVEVRSIDEAITITKVQTGSEAIRLRRQTPGYGPSHRIDFSISLDQPGQFDSYLDVFTTRMDGEPEGPQHLRISGYVADNVREYRLPVAAVAAASAR